MPKEVFIGETEFEKSLALLTAAAASKIPLPICRQPVERLAVSNRILLT